MTFLKSSGYEKLFKIIVFTIFTIIVNGILLVTNPILAFSATFEKEAVANNPLNGVDVGSNSSPTFVDIDNDGDYDLFVGMFLGAVNYYENTGTSSSPTFVEELGANHPLNGVDVGTYSMPRFVDIYDDGDYDFFIGETSGVINYYRNTGTNSSPTFVEESGSNNPFNGIDVGSYSCPSFIDIDDDGDYDSFIGNSTGAVNYYENTGTSSSPTFVEESGSNNPLDLVDTGDDAFPDFVDIDNDGDYDVFVGEWDSVEVNYYENSGTSSSPTFVEESGANNPLDSVSANQRPYPAIVDIDDDGDSDVFIGMQSGIFYYYKNVTEQEIDVQGNSTSISDGDSTPSTSDYTDFGSAVVDSTTVSRTFYIYNTGGGTLSITSAQISGTNSSDFSITTSPSSSVSSGSIQQ